MLQSFYFVPLAIADIIDVVFEIERMRKPRIVAVIITEKIGFDDDAAPGCLRCEIF